MIPASRSSASPAAPSATTLPVAQTPADRSVRVGGFVFNETFRPAGLRIPAHRHEHMNLALALDGHFLETVGDTPHDIEPGDFLVRPAGEPHSNRYGRASSRSLVIEVAAPGDPVLEVARALRRAEHVRGGPIPVLAQRVARELRSRDAAAPLAIESLTLEILVLLARRPAADARRAPAWLGRVVERLRDAGSELPGVAELAALAGVHPSHLARAFRAHHGCAIGEYARRLRLDAALDRLRDRGATIAEVALEAGFYDQSHFTRMFRRRFGVTPAAYRASRPAPRTKTHHASKN